MSITLIIHHHQKKINQHSNEAHRLSPISSPRDHQLLRTALRMSGQNTQVPRHRKQDLPTEEPFNRGYDTNTNNCTEGKSLKATIHLYCLIPAKMAVILMIPSVQREIFSNFFRCPPFLCTKKERRMEKLRFSQHFFGPWGKKRCRFNKKYPELQQVAEK